MYPAVKSVIIQYLDCCGCFTNEDSQKNEINERTHLLADTIPESPSTQHIFSYDIGNQSLQDPYEKEYAEELMNAILRSVERQTIHVARTSANTNNLKSMECLIKEKLSNEKLQQQDGDENFFTFNFNVNFVKNTPEIKGILSSSIISNNDKTDTNLSSQIDANGSINGTVIDSNINVIETLKF